MHTHYLRTINGPDESIQEVHTSVITWHSHGLGPFQNIVKKKKKTDVFSNNDNSAVVKMEKNPLGAAHS